MYTNSGPYFLKGITGTFNNIRACPSSIEKTMSMSSTYRIFTSEDNTEFLQVLPVVFAPQASVATVPLIVMDH